ncbi:MAG: citrate synthase [Clostridiaceae bacterium]|nr:citrate synthase [Clostridiaceae bacterium]
MDEINKKGPTAELVATYDENVQNDLRIDPELFRRYNVKRGLRNDNGTGVLVGLTEVGEVYSYILDDAERIPTEGYLFYRGLSITDIVRGFYGSGRLGFEECASLLLFGHLPTESQLKAFHDSLTENSYLPPSFTEDMIFRYPSRDIMNKLARNVLALYAHDPDGDSIDLQNVLRQSLMLIARFPLLIAYSYVAMLHYLDNKSLFVHAPLPEYSIAENILRMIRPSGEFTELEARILDLMLVLHAEHGGGNNSTFAVRAVTSTGTDTYSAIAAGIGSLKGPQHGGAANKAFQMMEHLKETVKDYGSDLEIRNALISLLAKKSFDQTGLIYGIGHAVYTLSDPRAVLLREHAEDLAVAMGREEEFAFYRKIEALAPQVLRDYRGEPDKPYCANVDFYSGLVYDMLNIPSELFTPLFAAARVAGWSAHRLEELGSSGKIIRPAYKNVKRRRKYRSMPERRAGLDEELSPQSFFQ